MSNEMVPSNFGPVSAKFRNVEKDNELEAGIKSGFGLIGYRGKVWSIRYRGEERPLMREDGDGPRGSIEVVLLKAAGNLSKIFYENGYIEGSNAAPDCSSANGLTPDAGVPNKKASSCATCPMNAWGSRVTPAGKQGKACSDSKRIAVAPLNDINNEVYGGPMLLRVPAASLNDLAHYGTKMKGLGYPYYGIATRISFDPKESYPKFVFQGIRPLTDDEAVVVLKLRDDPTVSRVLSEVETEVRGEAPQASMESAFEQPPAPVAPAPVPVAPAPVAKTLPPHNPETGEVVEAAPKRTYKKTPAPAATPARTPEPVAAVSAAEDDLDAKLAALLSD
jgi:hypothetical protein